MRPLLLQKNTQSTLQSFVARHALVPHLYNQWHYHKEIELLYVVKSNGTRFVGESIQPFFEGDMVLIGSNVPHFWQNEEKYFQGKEELRGEVILVQFLDTFAGEAFQLPEMIHIPKLLEKALHGIQFIGETRNLATQHLWSLVADNGENKIIQLLALLDLLAKSSEYRLLSDFAYQPQENQHSERIRKVCDYLLTHYKNPISLDEVAGIANMTEKAFCRFFKKSTQKTLLQFVSELRISHACKLLLYKEYPISDICFESGFNNLSNFNRVFKDLTGQTPREYQKSKMDFHFDS